MTYYKNTVDEAVGRAWDQVDDLAEQERFRSDWMLLIRERLDWGSGDAARRVRDKVRRGRDPSPLDVWHWSRTMAGDPPFDAPMNALLHVEDGDGSMPNEWWLPDRWRECLDSGDKRRVKSVLSHSMVQSHLWGKCVPRWAALAGWWSAGGVGPETVMRWAVEVCLTKECARARVGAGGGR